MMTEQAGVNRREHVRFEARIRVKLKFDNVKNLRQFYTKDVSQGGLFIVAENPKPIGTGVEIVIYPPGAPLGFPIQGIVVHIIDGATAKSRGAAPGMGIRFVDMTSDRVSSIKAYVDSMSEIEREETVVAKSPATLSDVVGRPDNLQSHVRTIDNTLSHPQKRTADQESNGVKAEGGDAVLEQANEKTRSEDRAPLARKFGDHVSKGEKLIDAAMEDLRANKMKSALSNIRLALSFDPNNEKGQKLLKMVLDKGGGKGPRDPSQT